MNILFDTKQCTQAYWLESHQIKKRLVTDKVFVQYYNPFSDKGVVINTSNKCLIVFKVNNTHFSLTPFPDVPEVIDYATISNEFFPFADFIPTVFPLYSDEYHLPVLENGYYNGVIKLVYPSKDSEGNDVLTVNEEYQLLNPFLAPFDSFMVVNATMQYINPSTHTYWTMLVFSYQAQNVGDDERYEINRTVLKVSNIGDNAVLWETAGFPNEYYTNMLYTILGEPYTGFSLYKVYDKEDAYNLDQKCLQVYVVTFNRNTNNSKLNLFEEQNISRLTSPTENTLEEVETMKLTPLIESGGVGEEAGVLTSYPDGGFYYGRKQKNYLMGMFTSDEAAHVYVIKHTNHFYLRYTENTTPYHISTGRKYHDCVGSSVKPALYTDINLYSSAMQADTGFIVEKRKKSDFSLVETFDVTPVGINYMNVHACLQSGQLANPVEEDDDHPWAEYNASVMTVPLQRLLPSLGTNCGTVLVSEDGTEYPILMAQSFIQANFNVRNWTGAVGTDNRKNLLIQGVPLWLTKAAPEGFNSFGCDAVGLVSSGSNLDFTDPVLAPFQNPTDPALVFGQKKLLDVAHKYKYTIGMHDSNVCRIQGRSHPARYSTSHIWDLLGAAQDDLLAEFQNAWDTLYTITIDEVAQAPKMVQDSYYQRMVGANDETDQCLLSVTDMGGYNMYLAPNVWHSAVANMFQFTLY